MILKKGSYELIRSVIKDKYKNYVFVSKQNAKEKSKEEEGIIHVYLYDNDNLQYNTFFKKPVLIEDYGMVFVDEKYIDSIQYSNAPHLSAVMNSLSNLSSTYVYTINTGFEVIIPRDDLYHINRILSLALKKKYRNIQFRFVDPIGIEADNTIIRLLNSITLNLGFYNDNIRIYNNGEYSYYIMRKFIKDKFKKFCNSGKVGKEIYNLYKED